MDSFIKFYNYVCKMDSKMSEEIANYDGFSYFGDSLSELCLAEARLNSAKIVCESYMKNILKIDI